MEKKVFISHSKEDKFTADIICTALETEGIGCWIAPRDIPYGNDWAGDITKAIEKCELFVFLLSKSSNKSRQCPKEISLADSADKSMICIKIDNSEMSEGIKYHFIMSQMLILDTTSINTHLNELIVSVKDKLSFLSTAKNNPSNMERTSSFVLKGGFPVFEDDEVGTDSKYNIDEQLDEKFNELFSKDRVEEEFSPCGVQEKIEKIAAERFFFDFEKNVKKFIAPDDNEFLKYYVRPSLVYGEETGFICEKHFSIPTRLKTAVFQISAKTDYITQSMYSGIKLLDCDENEESSEMTVYVENLPVGGAELLILHFDSANGKAFINVGILNNDEVRISKKPMFMTFRKLCVEDNTIVLCDAAYENGTVDFKHDDTAKENEERWIDADINMVPTIIVDPETARPVLREVYYDEINKCKKAKIKLTPQKSYFVFQIRNNDTNTADRPLTALEKGKYYRKGLFGFQKDIISASRYLEEDGSAEAFYELALIFDREEDFKDENTYFDYLFKSIEQHFEKSVVELAICVYFGSAQIRTVSECIELLRNNISEESTVGSFMLGYLMEMQNLPEAFNFYYISAKNGFLPAMVRLQCTSSIINNDALKDKVFQEFVKSHEEGNGLSQYCMGSVLFYGIDIEERRSCGLKLLEEAASLGDTFAQNDIFEIFDSDIEFKNEVNALHWLEIIAEYDEDVFVKLSDRYIDGIGCEINSENDKKAFDLLSRLINSNKKVAINNLGWMFKNGRGCETDYKKARDCFEKASEMGNATSSFHLGTMYEEGLGVNVDVDKAIKMYKIAAENNHRKAKERLEQIQNIVPPNNPT